MSSTAKPQLSLDHGASEAFLRTPGQMGRLIAEFDWATTPLGPIESWNTALKTSLSLMLNSQHPMWIGWGPEATFLYNDAYISVLSHAKHPEALGQPASKVWAEIWDFCGPIAAKVFDHGQATFVDDVQLFMDRRSFIEETYFSFSYSPIADANGRVAGLFCPSTDATAKNINARRLGTLSELSARALNEQFVDAALATVAAALAANPSDLPFVLIYLVDTESGELRLAQAVCIEPGHAASPARISLEGPRTALERQICDAVARVESKVVSAVGLEGLPLGLANQAIRELMVLPVHGSSPDEPLGVVVAGVSPASYLDDEYRAFFGLMVDQIGAAVSNAKAAQEQQQRLDMLAELDRAKTAFFSNVSHEFRTPLTLILGPLNEALDAVDKERDPLLSERLLLMQRNALRLQKLVNTLLDFSQSQAGRMEVAFKPVDLAEYTTDLASGFRSLVESAGLQFKVSCEPLPAPVYVDPLMWEKIVLNLLSNAFKFTFQGSVTVTLALRGDLVELVVADTGIGIDEEGLSKVFDRFHRVVGARSRTHEGSGIGLALVKDLVSLHSGSIEVASEVGRGTTFTVLVPAGQEHLSDAQLGAISGDVLASATTPLSYIQEAESWLVRAKGTVDAPVPVASDLPVGAGTILVADDNPDMRTYLQRLFEPHYQVELVANGAEALRVLDSLTPDVIISDVMMPELDGFGLLAKLREREATRRIPVLLLSARAGDESRIEGLNAGASDYLVKPFSSQELLARVQSQMLRAKLGRIEAELYQRMAMIFEQMPIGIAILAGSDYTFELANPAYLALINHRKVLGTPLLVALPEVETQGIVELLDGVAQSRQPFVGRAIRLDIRNVDGVLEEHFFDFVYQPLINPDGQVDRIAAVVTDVTAVTQAGRSAELASRTKDEFLAMLGHELRNPLAPISIALEIMRMRGGDALSRERAIIERQTQHMIRLVDDLLDVSRIAQGKITLRQEPVEISAIAARAVELASPLMEERRQQFRGDVPARGLTVAADMARLSQVFANLLTNAAKYTDPNGSIELRAFAEGNQAVIEVVDSGIGIAASSLPFIFDKFVQERQTLDRARGGMGLGLAIVKSLTELHGGTVSAHSAGAGQGRKFVVRLPLVRVEGAHGSPQGGVAIGPLVRADHLRQRVLVVDDNVDILLMLEELLALEGFEVKSAGDPPAALKLARDFVPDIALLDIGLPGMDGYELVQELKRIPELKGTRFIAVTGYGQTTDRELSSKAGFSAHLVKPIDLDQLRELLVVKEIS